MGKLLGIIKDSYKWLVSTLTSLAVNTISLIKGLRKWSIMMIIIVIGVYFLTKGLLTGVEFVALIKGVAIAFMSSNAVEHIKDVFTGKGKKEDMSED